MSSALKVTSATNSAKVGNALLPLSCCSVWTFVDHFVENQFGSFSTRVCSLEGNSKIFRLCS